MFENIVLSMQDMSIFHLFLPWLLVLTVTYGVLQKQEIFEEEAVTAATSLSVAFLSIGGFYFFVPPEMFSHFAAVIGFAIFGFIGLFLLLAVVGVDITEFEDVERRFPAIAAASIAVLGALGVLTYQYNLLGLLPELSELTTLSIDFDQHVMPILTLLFLLAIVIFVARGE